MANPKEIRSKIKSVQSTKKITGAMEMVAASKMRKAQERMLATRPYADRILTVVDHLASGSSEYNHPYLIKRDLNRMGLIIVSSDRGLCGGLNSNLFRFVLDKIENWQQKGIELDLCIIGKKAEAFFKKLQLPILAATTQMKDNPSVLEVIGPIAVMLEAYEAGKLDGLCIVYNRFVNTMTQKTVLLDLLPIVASKKQMSKENAYAAESNKALPWDYIYEPDAKELIDLLLTRFIESSVYQAVVENFACEQAARMVAMKAATDNAAEIIEALKLDYNKARQAAITRELSEIVAGAAAV